MLDQRWTSQRRRSVLVGATLLFALLAILAESLETTRTWLQLTSPVVITLCVLWWLRLLYFWWRKAAFRRRDRRRKQNPAETLDIPGCVKKPEQYEGGKTSHEAQWIYIGRAVAAQGNYFATGILAAILPPLALFLLSLQLLALPTGGRAIGLILSEMSCLVILVYLALTNREPTAEWIENRIRTELFRREQYLLLAGVGPYLFRKTSEEDAEEALRRRGQIEGADAHTLVGLVPLQDRSGLTWLEALHQRGSAKLPARSDLIERMESYLYYRIGKQLVWFANEIRDLRENEQTWSRLLTGTLLGAVAIAAVHAFHLHGANAAAKADDGTGYWRIVTGTLAIVLPPLGTACLNIRAIYNFRGRSRTYEHESIRPTNPG